VIEAYAKGTPVVASNKGAMAELVRHQETGLLVEAGNADQLTASVEMLLDEPELRQRMRCAARAEFEQGYTADRNHELLMEIYHQAIGYQPEVLCEEEALSLAT
jgi:glycosyltransferase involved in cell wall biosynthesis